MLKVFAVIPLIQHGVLEICDILLRYLFFQGFYLYFSLGILVHLSGLLPSLEDSNKNDQDPVN